MPNTAIASSCAFDCTQSAPSLEDALVSFTREGKRVRHIVVSHVGDAVTIRTPKDVDGRVFTTTVDRVKGVR